MLKSLPFHGGKVSYRISGSGPALVFLHGFLLHSGIWKDLIPYFEKTYTVICPDLPGHGGSFFPDPHLSMESMADAVHAVLHNEDSKPASVIGHSMGGYVALALLEKYPGDLSSLMLLNSYPWSDSPEKRQVRERILALLEQGKKDLFLREVFRSLFSSSVIDLSRYQAEACQMMDSIDGSSIKKISIAMRDRTDRTKVFKEAAIPTTWVIGKQDTQNRLEDLVQKAEEFKMPRPEIVDLGHLSFVEKPEVVAGRVKIFLEKKPDPHAQ